MNNLLTFVKEVCRDTILFAVYFLIVFIPAAMMIGSCNALIEIQINNHKLWDAK